jgi:hypothetical protein
VLIKKGSKQKGESFLTIVILIEFDDQTDKLISWGKKLAVWDKRLLFSRPMGLRGFS